MDYFAGLDVSVKDTSVCIVDDAGRIKREVRVASEPEALLTVLRNPAYRFKRIGLEAGPLSQWLFSALVLPSTLVAESDGGGSAKIEFRRIIVHPGGREEVEGVTPKEPPAADDAPPASE